jgi:hypothetical protein
MGWNATGIEVLPVGFYAIEARARAERVDPDEFADEVRRAASASFGGKTSPDFAFQHIRITEGAFGADTEREMAGYLAYCERSIEDDNIKAVFRFACFCVLEEVSFTRKDGQYLRWDYRSPKKRSASHFDKGQVRSFRDAILGKLSRMAEDIRDARANNGRRKPAVDIRRGSCLDILPEMPADSFDVVLTSPPYCNRYDYTRTYALELAFLEFDGEQVKALRQAMLSCTVENKEKTAAMARFYAGAGQTKRFALVERVFNDSEGIQEVLDALEHHRKAGNLNNTNVPRMVRNYFYEMCFVVSEMSRVLRPGGSVVMINDNVRYAGDEIPVDLLLSDFAEKSGLTVKQIWTLPRGKGNSSQQMGSHGRQELRKCVYVWEKPRHRKQR